MTLLRQFYTSYLSLLDQHQRTVWVIVLVSLSALMMAMLAANVSISPDRVAIVLFVIAVFLGQGISFLRDWIPFLFLLIAYESLRGFADILPDVHITDVIAAERLLFMGSIPTLWLQESLFTGQVGWLEITGTIIYFLHFPLPLCFAFWLWLKNKQWYWQFVTSLVVLCLAGFITYVVFPVMPPWMAGRDGYLDPVAKIIDQVLQLFPNQMSVSYLYHSLNPNQVAAIPSLHAAWPWLVFIMLRRLKGRKAWLFLPYCLAVWFSIVYLGEHYVVDALIGILYAQVAFWAGLRVYPWLTTTFSQWLGRQPSDKQATTLSTEHVQ